MRCFYHPSDVSEAGHHSDNNLFRRKVEHPVHLDEGIRDVVPGPEPEGVVEHGEVEASHGHTAPLGPGVAAPHWSGENAPEDVIVIEELEESLLEDVREGHLPVHHGDTQLDVRLFLISVDGQPLVSKEPGLLSSLDVVDDDVAEVPGLHLPDAGVVVPDPQVLQGSQGSRWQILSNNDNKTITTRQ